jgi:hypothetical protein
LLALAPWLGAVAPQDPAAAGQGQQITLEDLRKQLAELDEKHSDEIDELKFQIATLEQEVAAAKSAAQQGRAQSNNVFNPAITVFGNFLGRVDDIDVFLDDDPAAERVDDQMNLREAELDFRAPIDPWADGVLILSVESEVPNEFETSIEEGYLTLKKLPFFDAAPGGLKLQIGRFHQDFGRFNKIHLHDLPQPSYPRALTNFLGAESFVQVGAAGQFFLPSPSEASTLQATVAALDGGNIPLDPQERASNIAGLGHVAWFSELGETHTLDLGASAWTEDSDHALFGVDVTYEWKPLAGGEWRSFLLGGELFSAALDDPAFSDHPLGFFVWSQYQFTKNVYLGVRFDRSEELADESQATNTYGAYLTYYTSEFLRLRFGLEHADSDVDVLDGRDTALVELNMVFGSHPAEPYWVNR